MFGKFKGNWVFWTSEKFICTLNFSLLFLLGLRKYLWFIWKEGAEWLAPWELTAPCQLCKRGVNAEQRMTHGAWIELILISVLKKTDKHSSLQGKWSSLAIIWPQVEGQRNHWAVDKGRRINIYSRNMRSSHSSTALSGCSARQVEESSLEYPRVYSVFSIFQ